MSNSFTSFVPNNRIGELVICRGGISDFDSIKAGGVNRRHEIKLFGELANNIQLFSNKGVSGIYSNRYSCYSCSLKAKVVLAVLWASNEKDKAISLAMTFTYTKATLYRLFQNITQEFCVIDKILSSNNIGSIKLTKEKYLNDTPYQPQKNNLSAYRYSGWMNSRVQSNTMRLMDGRYRLPKNLSANNFKRLLYVIYLAEGSKRAIELLMKEHQLSNEVAEKAIFAEFGGINDSKKVIHVFEECA